ncbi:MAG: LD-carboxypeptidase [Lachnospiraceae bacterium]|nr:LD-carboxypeptidase [Lachnospiraceae bacterium]
MRYSKFVKPGDTLGFIAPSMGCNVEPYNSALKNALKRFTERGYKLDLGENCFEGSGIGISNTPEKCAEEVMDHFTGDTDDMIFSCGGGELMCETISHVDFDKLAASEPKWFTGYSDNTNLIFLLATLCDTAALYGPCAPAYGMEPWHKCLHDAMDVLEGKRLSFDSYDKWQLIGLKDEEHPLLPYNCTEPNEPKAWNGDFINSLQMSGRLIGGCMDCLVNLTGTRFDKVSDFLERYKDDGFIWFLESCDLNVFSMRRAMWQMYEAGWFKYCKGFLFGRPMHFDEPMFGLDRFGALLDIAAKLSVPAIMDADLGHMPPAMPIICGSIGHIGFADSRLRLDMELR